MRLKAVLAGLAALVLAAPAAADEITEQRKSIATTEANIESMERRLGSLLVEASRVEHEKESTYAALATSSLELHKLGVEANAARERLRDRARDAYKESRWRPLGVLLGSETLSEFLTSLSAFGRAMKSDASSLEDTVITEEKVQAQREIIDEQRNLIVTQSSNLDSLKKDIKAALDSQQEVLASAQSELDRLVEERRKAALARPSASRTKRRQELDRRLAALLAWYAPGSGLEPYYPSGLAPSGIVTTGLTSWYGPGFDRQGSASGATYKQELLTAASLTLPFGTLLKVSYNRRAVVVVIADRGPYVTGRVLDLSKGAADALGLRGVKEVRMEILLPGADTPPFP